MDGAAIMWDRPPPLKELVDIGSLAEVCRSFAELYGIGVRVYDVDGARLVDLRMGNIDFCGYVFGKAKGQHLCTATVQEIKSSSFRSASGDPRHEAIVRHTCFTGLRYLTLPLLHEMDLLGKIIMGPFLPDDLERLPDELCSISQDFDSEEATRLLSGLRRAPEETIRKVLAQLGSIIEVMVHSGYKVHLTSTMHIESVTATHHELLDKNQRLEESLDKLRELDRLKSNFLATVSHELRTPLTSIIGYSEMLLEGLVGDMSQEQRQHVATIMAKGDELLQLIVSILDISKIESGTVSLMPVELDLIELTETAVSTIKPHAQKKHLSIRTHLARELPVLHADKDKVRQCIVNLLANAVKFTPDQGEIEILIEPYVGARRHAPPASASDSGYFLFEALDEEFIRITVRDNGIGIDSKQKERIFDTFYQVDSSSTRAFGGAGLGLSIVKAYVEAHGGEVWVDSAPGRGSAFSLLFPAGREANSKAQSIAGSS